MTHNPIELAIFDTKKYFYKKVVNSYLYTSFGKSNFHRHLFPEMKNKCNLCNDIKYRLYKTSILIIFQLKSTNCLN